MNENPLKIIQDSDPELFEKIENSKDLAFQAGEISRKNKYLIALALDMSKHAEDGIRSLAIQALKNGATKKELMETLRIVNYICGVGSVYSAAAALKDIV